MQDYRQNAEWYCGNFYPQLVRGHYGWLLLFQATPWVQEVGGAVSAHGEKVRLHPIHHE